MKIFSMVFTVLFFLGFTSVAYAESVYTVTNKLENASTKIYLADVHRYGYGQPYNDVDYTAEPGTCLYVNGHDFDRLMITLSVPDGKNTTSRTSMTLCSPGHDTCKEANNYEIIYTTPWWDISHKTQLGDYEIETVNQPNSSRNCIDIESWMEIKEEEFLSNIPINLTPSSNYSDGGSLKLIK